MSAPSRWIVKPRPSPAARVRLLCLAHAGGSALFYRTWANALAPAIEVCAIELPGHGVRLGEPSFTRVEPLVAALAHAIAPILDRPFALFGHSMGALLAFELARHLEDARGPSPAHLLVSGYSAPQIPSRGSLHKLPKPEFLEAIGRFGGTPPELFQVPDLLDLYVPPLRADVELCETYAHRARVPLTCPLTALGGVDDAIAPDASFAGWADHTFGPFEHLRFQGGHFFLRHAERAVLESIARALSPMLAHRELASADAAPSP